MRRGADLNAGTMRAGVMGLWLLLLSILTHAAVPVDSPLERASGSAFSASTSDVSLAPVRSDAMRLRARAGGDDAANGGGDADADELAVASVSILPAALRFAGVAEADAFARTSDGGAASFRARAPPFSLI